eukprot:gnl/TRDRNA2_/TRDRNA2_52270_c0_seq1.p1 gnl/TRDRNA2_/TRDRNA2_52270_c0~~gnl/TRDRNA2_/TRDRNA2_52270_c0_seq1.p1  ORF type:complete len:636 (-),score=100.80 gnl/TRDRNA2_/TRDRNA2_52270_c0_seq1:66-1973(-)
MQDFSLLPDREGAKRDFADVMWQIAERRSCEEVLVRYDCNHCFKADVWIPVLPKTQEYTSQDADRRRFMQHSIFVLTKNPTAPKVQITVPDGRCRQCGRGQRQVLICGQLYMDLSEGAKMTDTGRPKASAKGVTRAPDYGSYGRVELPLFSHIFLAAMGQVCKLPDNITPPPLLQDGGVQQGSPLKPCDTPLALEGLHQWSRKEIEDELKAEVVKYVGGATFLLMFGIIECLYLCVVHFGPSSRAGGNAANGTMSVSGELRNLSSVSAIELGIANSTWVMSALTLSVHKAFGPLEDGKGEASGSFCWSFLIHPAWILLSALLAPLFWVLDLVVALPRFLLLNVVFALIRTVLWRPLVWLFSVFGDCAHGFWVLLLRCIFAQPIAPSGATPMAPLPPAPTPPFIPQATQMASMAAPPLASPIVTAATVEKTASSIPLTNPMAVAVVLSVLVAALSVPSPPGLTPPNIWSELPDLEIAQSLKRVAARHLGPLWQRLRAFWTSARKDARARGRGVGGAPAARGQRGDKSQAREHGDAPDGQVDVRAPKGQQKGSRASSGQISASSPACFVCLDRASRYILEPCGHRVVCGECAAQLVEAATRNRSMSDMPDSRHHPEKSSGTCPSCGLAISRAMRVFL